MKEIDLYQEIVFDSIRHVDNEGNEYWFTRELMKALKYIEWRKFKNVIDKVIIACSKSNNDVKFNFGNVDKIVKTGVSAKTIEDFKLAESHEFKNDSANQSFTVSPSRWISLTNDKGFISKKKRFKIS